MPPSSDLKKAGVFTLLVFASSYSLVFAYLGIAGRWLRPGSLIVMVIYMFMPTVAALIVQKLIYKEGVIGPLGVSFGLNRWFVVAPGGVVRMGSEVSFRLNRWFLVAWLLPLGLAFGALGVSLLFPGIRFDPHMTGLLDRYRAMLTPEQLAQVEQQLRTMPLMPFWVGVLGSLIAGPTINAVAGFGEELGWRGLLQRTLAGMGFWRSSLLIGVIWGFWHAPLIYLGHNYPGYPVAGIFMMTALTVLLAPVFSYVRLRARSVIAAAVLHGSLNATAGLAVVVVKGGTVLTIGVTGLAGFIVLALLNLAVFLHDRYVAREPVSAIIAAEVSSQCATCP